MSDDRKPLATFNHATIEEVAAEQDIEADALASLVDRHQVSVREMPGVEDIVYEWRSQFHQDPMVYQTESVYVLAHRPHVWEEFVEALELSTEESRALRAVHDRQAHALAGAEQLANAEPMVLTRP